MNDSRQFQDHSLAYIYLLYLDSYYHACGTSEQSQPAVSSDQPLKEPASAALMLGILNMN